MNIDKSFEADEGFLVVDGPFYTGGAASPVGLDLPTETFYLQNTAAGVLIWRKFGVGVNDWRQLSANDIPFDPTGSSLSSTELDGAVKEVSAGLDAKVFGNDFATATKQASETTTGNSFTEYHSINFNVTDSATNTYRLYSDFKWGHDSASNDIRVQLWLDGVLQGEEMRIEPKDAGTDQRIQNNLLRYANNLSIGSHTVSLRYRPSVSSRVSRMYFNVFEVWRVA